MIYASIVSISAASLTSKAMADSGTLGDIGKLIQFVIKVIFKLTVSLAVELLKFGALTLILIGVICTSVIMFLYVIRWSYISSDGNIIYTLCVMFGMILAVFATFAVSQVLLKDVLKLTDMTLLEIAQMWLKAGGKGKHSSSVETQDGTKHKNENGKKEL